jgi:hypothetical protein
MWDLPQPLLSPEVANRLITAARELELRPSVPDVAYYVAKTAVEALNPNAPMTARGRAASANTNGFNLHALLKGIVKVLSEIAEHSRVRTRRDLSYAPH